MTTTPYAYATPPRMGNIGADPVEWEIEPLDAPAAEPAPPVPAHPAPVETPERKPEPVPA